MVPAPFRVTSFAASLPLLAFGGAFAQSAAPVDPLEHIAPHERRAHIEQIIARQRAARVQSIDAAADTTPPVLTGLESAGTLDLSKADAKCKVTVKATDDLSGVRYLYFYAYGPSGQQIVAYGNPGYPAKSVSVLAGFSNGNRFIEPGTWSFNYAYG